MAIVLFWIGIASGGILPIISFTGGTQDKIVVSLFPIYCLIAAIAAHTLGV